MATLASVEPLAITAPGGITMSGLVLSAPSISLVSGGAIELRSNVITTRMLARLTGIGGAVVVGNELSQFELRIEESGAGHYSLIANGGNSPEGHPGAFVQDPLRSNGGLSEDRLSTMTDWDGNTCRDYPGEGNHVGEDGRCIMEGFSPPIW